MIKINLLPKTLRKRVEPGWWRLIAIIFPLLILGGILIAQVGLSNTLRAETEHRDQLQTEVNQLQQYVDGTSRLNDNIKTLTITKTVKTQLDQDQIKWSDDVFNFAKLLPRSGANTSVRLNSMNLHRYDNKATTGAVAYDGKTIVKEIAIQGKAKSSANIIAFLKNFENDPRFGVQLNQAEKNKEQDIYTFSANIGIVGETPVASAAPTTGTTTTGTTTPPAGSAANTSTAPATPPATPGASR